MSFLRAYVSSLEKLMLLLLVQRAAGGTVSVGIGARLLNIPVSEVRRIAGELAAHGLLRVTSQEVIEIGAPAIDDRLALADLAYWYTRDRSQVLGALISLSRSAS